MNPIFTKIFMTLLPIIIQAASPEIKKMLHEFLESMVEKTKKTANPYDDMLVKFLITIVE